MIFRIAASLMESIPSFRPFFFQLLLQQIVLGDMILLVLGIAANLNDFHAIQQRTRNRIQWYSPLR